MAEERRHVIWLEQRLRDSARRDHRVGIAAAVLAIVGLILGGIWSGLVGLALGAIGVLTSAVTLISAERKDRRVSQLSANVMHAYVWHPRDALDDIAKRFSTSLEAIRQANRVLNLDNLLPGQILCIPHSPKTPARTAQAYITKEGDTLSSIAQVFSKFSEEALARTNGIQDTNFRFAGGEVLCIPVPANRRFYIVKERDTLSEVARRFGLSPENIAKVNNIEGSETLSVGQVLWIPVDTRGV